MNRRVIIIFIVYRGHHWKGIVAFHVFTITIEVYVQNLEVSSF